MRTSTPSSRKSRSACVARSSGNVGNKPGTALDENYSRRRGVDLSEIAAQRVSCDCGQHAGQFNAGRSTANDDEGQKRTRSSASEALSACSNAVKNRRRISMASSMLFRPGAMASHSG